MPLDLVDSINAYESGEMDYEQVVEFFQYLHDTGTINHLQGSYQRQMADFIRSGEVVA